jgi:DNA-binding HxlR family transcriptional regulator
MNRACTKAFAALGDRYSLQLLSALAAGDERFCELQRGMKLNPITLTARLKKLEQLKFVSRISGSVNGLSVSYRLTPLGREALPIVQQIERFAKKL